MKIYLKITFIALLCVLFLGACPQEEENKVEAGLVGNWSNELSGDDLKTFTINSDGSFSATLSPPGGEGTVEGVLIKDGNDYKMNKMKVTAGKPSWSDAVGMYNNTYVQIVLSENDAVFELKCKDNNIVEQFFGGKYYKQ